MNRLQLTIMSSCVLLSCGDCKDGAESHRQGECALIVKSSELSSRRLHIEGTNYKTGEPEEYKDESGWYVSFGSKIEPGDTVIKRKGEVVFYIHKPDTVLVFPCVCEGVMYK